MAVKALWPLARPLLHRLDPERAHDLTLRALALMPLPDQTPDDPRLAVEAFGLSFANPIGLAAGFDKNGTVSHKAAARGFGFAEVGTLTPLPQSGNPKPRLFRLPEHGAVINRFGFNNLGHAAALSRLRKSRSTLAAAPIGINVGANKDAADRVADYVAGIHAFAGRAAYFTINVSSPNTPGLRDLQQPDALDGLLARVLDARDTASPGTAVLLKIAPDLSPAELDGIVAVARRRRIDGMIVSNTTLARDPVAAHRHGGEMGGLSGRPLFVLSTRMLAECFRRVEQQFPLIGVGGVEDAETAMAKIEAGASLLQLYSALVFGGPALVAEIKRGLVAKLGSGETLASRAGRSA